MRTGGKILIDQLALHGVRHVFTVPGESFLAALDALFDVPVVRTITCRHEGGATMMAEASGKLTGRPGVAFVTRGPGAANAAAGLHIAEHDQTPLLLLVGLPPAEFEHRGAFQEIALERMFASVAKWVAVVRDPRRIPEHVARAMRVAMSGRPGPVVLGFPEDVLEASAACDDGSACDPPQIAPYLRSCERLVELLAAAERPLAIVGGPGWTEAAQRDLEAFATAFDLPVAAAFRAQDRLDNRHPCFVGPIGIAVEPKLASAIRSADLILALGAPLGEVTTGGYTLIAPPNPAQRLVHVLPDADGLGRVFHTTLPIVAHPEPLSAMLARCPPPAVIRWAALRRDLRRAYETWRAPVAQPAPATGTADFAACITVASDRLPDTAIVTNGAGNYAAFLNRHFTYKGFGTQLAPASGSMGYGLPAAIAAKLLAPDRPVVAFAGDGCFMMTANELSTALQYALPVVVIIANNGMYGTIRMHQELNHPGRVVGTSLVNPDFAAMARSFGAIGETVASTADFGPALARALAADRPAVLDVRLDPERITPQQSLADLRRTP